jgi:hypothetical protein
LFSYLRRRNTSVASKELTAEQNQQIDALLNSISKNDRG